MAAEAEGIGDSNGAVTIPGLQRTRLGHVVEAEALLTLLPVDSRRGHALAKRKQGDNRLHRARRAQCVPDD
jgi:pyridoxal biosynthesis lyase PdxS